MNRKKGLALLVSQGANKNIYPYLLGKARRAPVFCIAEGEAWKTEADLRKPWAKLD